MADDLLTRELARIEAACNAAANGVGSMCLVRVVEGLDAEGWRRLKDELSLDLWVAAPPSQLVRGLGAVSLMDADSPLHDYLLGEMDRARLCQQPLALALIESEGVETRDEVFDLVRAQLRRFDHASMTHSGIIAVALSGTPLAAAERLVGTMLRRIRQVSEPDFICSAGLVGYGGLVELTTAALVEHARGALAEARRLGGNRLEVAPSADAALASRETLVRASEKHFLFTGKKLPE